MKGKAMADYPILFKGDMVRAILDGRKTMTRRVVKPQPESTAMCPVSICQDAASPSGYSFGSDMIGLVHIGCPYGKVGGKLWVRETWRIDACGLYGNHLGAYVDYRAHHAGYRQFKTLRDGDEITQAQRYCIKHRDDKWSPSIHMPRWASRITLEITSLAVERVAAITEDDARNEGLRWVSGYAGGKGIGAYSCTDQWPPATFATNAVEAFRHLWDSINAKRGYPWSDEDLPDNLKTGHGLIMHGNPWVWVIGFKLLKDKEGEDNDG